MTPQEQQLVADLFDRLSSLESQRRDADAERLIADGLRRAPNAVYALVQSVLVQDEALKRASARIDELERAHGSETGSGGFLDSMRNTLGGHEQATRGSVPSVRPGGQGSSGAWGPQPQANPINPSQDYAQPYPNQPGGGMAGGGMMGGGMAGGGMMGMPAPGVGGGSFLGTAAATVAGVVGGAMLLNGIRSMMGGHSFGNLGPMGPAHAASPWDSGGDRGGSLAHAAGADDIGGSRAAAYDDPARSSLFGGNAGGDADDQADDDQDGGDFDNGDGGDYSDGGDYGDGGSDNA